MRFFPPTIGPWKNGNSPSKDISVLMSGGVDSSVAAMLLKQAGYNVLGITMKIPTVENCDYRRSCCGMEAAYVCKDLGIPHHYLDVREAFHDLVIRPFREAYQNGETPSPCVDCNTLFKFSLVWNHIEEVFGIQRLATGHYARVGAVGEEARLMRAHDQCKDQSYFLYGIPRQRLERLVLPLGDLHKQEVRSLAREARLPVARRAESMELCFAGAADYRRALTGVSTRGPILDSQGSVLGEHKGIANYTVGQRRGLGIATGKPLYVTGILPEQDSVRVGPWDEALQCAVTASDVNVLVRGQVHPGACLFGKIRSQGACAACEVVKLQGQTVSVVFDQPQFAPAPGQRLVLYNTDGHVVAGGKIR